ncbi:MAG: fatty acid desaturase [Leptolyngbyaceae cyanobacterium bins.302]|nr:fatty acid desaturase [Leptolyngbyaceae cyanobacterium bins.302]
MDQLQRVSRGRLISIANIKFSIGITIAFVIIGLWLANLMTSLFLDLSKVSTLYVVLVLLLQAFLCTGLFITAHDAMHRSLIPYHVHLNDQIGSLALFLYLFFPYQKLLEKHWQHHRHPASAMDPDFHDGQHSHPVLWYFNFIRRYFGWSQGIGITIAYLAAQYVFHIPQINLVLFWIFPCILSSLQLFYFGTYLPHRELPQGYNSTHRARSNSLPPFLSFLSCYHFGYHEEHHEYPAVPWWQLPAIRKTRLKVLAST